MLESYLLKPDTAVGHRAGVHAPDRRRRLPADDQRAGPRGTPRHLLQQPIPRHRLRAADGEGRRGPRRVHQGRQEPARLLEGRPRRLERRRLAVGVLPAAGAEPDGDGQPVRRRARPDQARADPRRRHHAARRAHQQARHHDRVDGRVDPRRERPDQAGPRARPLQPGQPEPAAVHAGVPGALPRGADRAESANHQVGQGETRRAQGGRTARRRVRVRRARHHGRPALAGPDGRSERTRPGHLLSGRSSGREHEPGRPGPVLHVAQLAVAMELRRRQRRRGQGRPRHRRARAGDRQPRRRRLHAEPHPQVVRGHRASRQGDARDPRRQPLLRGRRSARQAARSGRHRHRLAGTATTSRPPDDRDRRARSTASG